MSRITRPCEACGKPMTAHRKTKRTCSNVCRQKLHRQEFRHQQKGCVPLDGYVPRLKRTDRLDEELLRVRQQASGSPHAVETIHE